MFTVEQEADYTAITTLDETAMFEDVEVVMDADVVYISQVLPDSNRAQVLELSYQQLKDILVAMDLPEGAYYQTAKGEAHVV